MIRKDIIKGVRSELSSRLEESSLAIERLKESVRTETKSSMGDKFETSREMMKSELGKLEESHSRLLKYQHTMNQVGEGSIEPVGAGSVIEYANQYVVIGPALGQVKLQTERVVCISPASPVAQKLMGKRSGDHIEINENSFQIRVL